MAAKSRGAKRLMQELSQMEEDPPADFLATPLEDDLFHWHFTLRLKNDEFAGGMYHGRIMLPPEYPLRPPEIYLLTPNGRFELNKRICLSITGYHEDQWSPSWGIRLALTSLCAFFATEAKGAIAGLDTPPAERRRLAKLSPDWSCSTCKQSNAEILADKPPPNADDMETLPSVETSQPLPIPVHPPSSTSTPTLAPAVTDAAQPALAPPQPASQNQLTNRPAQGEAMVVASVMQPSPPTWLDRFIVSLLVVFVGLIARQMS